MFHYLLIIQSGFNITRNAPFDFWSYQFTGRYPYSHRDLICLTILQLLAWPLTITAACLTIDHFADSVTRCTWGMMKCWPFIYIIDSHFIYALDILKNGHLVTFIYSNDSTSYLRSKFAIMSIQFISYLLKYWSCHAI